MVETNLKLLEQYEIIREQRAKLAVANLKLLERTEELAAARERAWKLLLNILPENVEIELETHGKAKAQIYINGETFPASTVLIGEHGTVALLHLATADADNDGVPDELDNCPDAPEGEFVDADGCSPSQLIDDTDGDGVPDDVDVCPGYDDIPDVNNNGIPDCLDDADTDGDGFTDREEVLCGSNPDDKNSVCSRFMPCIYLLLSD